MKFAELESFRSTVRMEHPDVLDCAETNLYRALARLAVPETPLSEQTVHRCHLAAEWADWFHLPPEMASRALVSSGVRDSLATLFAHYATQGASLWLPEDNYPVYAQLATAADLPFQGFPTLPEPSWPTAAAAGPELLLVTNPMKPRGRWLDDADVDALLGWLNQSPERRLLLDVVYGLTPHVHRSTQRLVDAGQTILLHSVTKGWLAPRSFGVALVPEADTALHPLFRARPPSQASLGRARHMFGAHRSTPVEVERALETARARLLDALPAGLPFLPCDAPGYFTPVRLGYRELIEVHGVLGIPASVFGSTRTDITILSSLGYATAGRSSDSNEEHQHARRKAAS